MNDRNRNREQQTQSHHVSDGSSVTLVTQLTRELTTLFSKEVALARSELTHAMQSAKKGATSVAAGGMVLFAGFLVLLLAAVIGLSNVMQPWLAAVIVGGIVTFIGLIMVQSGKKKLEPGAFKPTHTAHSLRKDRDAVRGATT